MGVDPGTNILGYSIIRADKASIKILINGVIQLKKTDSHFIRLRQIYDKLHHLIVNYQPAVLAIEAPFYGKNVQSMLKLGRAQGAAILAAVNNHIEIVEYSPRRIKQSITGNGSATKQQVAKLLQSIVKFEELSKSYDETDALATAVCHFHSNRLTTSNGKQFKDWGEFIKSRSSKLSGLM